MINLGRPTRPSLVEDSPTRVDRSRLSFEESFKMSGSNQNGQDKGEGNNLPKSKRAWIKLGELFTSAGLLSESNGLKAVEAALMDGRPVGEVLVSAGLLSKQTRDSGLELQNMVAQGQVNAKQAANLLREINKHEITPTQALKYLSHLGSQVANLLKMAGLINDEDLRKAVEAAEATQAVAPSAIDMSDCLVEASIINFNTVEAARQCLELIRDDQLKVEQAFAILSYCMRSHLTVKETLAELGWDRVITI